MFAVLSVFCHLSVSGFVGSGSQSNPRLSEISLGAFAKVISGFPSGTATMSESSLNLKRRRNYNWWAARRANLRCEGIGDNASLVINAGVGQCSAARWGSAGAGTARPCRFASARHATRTNTPSHARARWHAPCGHGAVCHGKPRRGVDWPTPMSLRRQRKKQAMSGHADTGTRDMPLRTGWKGLAVAEYRRVCTRAMYTPSAMPMCETG